jgi:hypothetical protein
MGVVVKLHGRLLTAGKVRPKTAGSGFLPSTRKAFTKTKKCSEGILPRAFQLYGALPDFIPVSSQAADAPPTASITSATELSIPNGYSQTVIVSTPHGLRLEFVPKSAMIGSMVMRAKTAQKQEASRLDRVQVALELTNDALAGKIGITAHAWSQYRTGARPISRDALRMLRKDYGISADYILFDDPSKLPQDIYAKIRILGAA